ncbi:hypothetical protein BDR07DRAFT_1084032 [Suillus spraguei]|nr:hypothetical protein BDR07DRAFT_1084032 [Suillus spraguei]
MDQTSCYERSRSLAQRASPGTILRETSQPPARLDLPILILRSNIPQQHRASHHLHSNYLQLLILRHLVLLRQQEQLRVLASPSHHHRFRMRARFMLWICCIPIQHISGQH